MIRILTASAAAAGLVAALSTTAPVASLGGAAVAATTKATHASGAHAKTAHSKAKAKAKAKTKARAKARAKAREAAAKTPTTTLAKTTTSAATPTATAATPTNCGGNPTLEASGRTWTCSFDDEFDGTTLDTSKWYVMTTAETGFTNAGECYMNSPDNVSVGNGYLSLTARTSGVVSLDGCSTTGGFVSTIKSFSQAYGRFEIRAAFPNVKVAGVQSSLWMWPKSSPYGSWPTSGEIDIAEYYSANPDRAIPYIHYSPSGTDPNVTNNYCLLADPSQFHTYLLEWTPQTLTVKFDGVTCISDNWNPAAPLQKPAPFDVPFFLNLTQGLGVYQNQYNPLLTPLPATTKVDYVRAWSGSF